MRDANLERNFAHCEQMIESYAARIKNARATGEDVGELRKASDGYKEKRKQLLK